MMSMKLFGRCGIALILAVFISGCGSSPRERSGGDDECHWRRSSCLYEGAYETGERDYAEQEARRLNQAQALRMRDW